MQYIRITGDADALDVWHEYEKATLGKRSLSWSQGIRAELLPEDQAEELSDEARLRSRVVRSRGPLQPLAPGPGRDVTSTGPRPGHVRPRGSAHPGLRRGADRLPAGGRWTEKRFDRLQSRLDARDVDSAGAHLAIEGRSPDPDDPTVVDIDVGFQDPHEGADVRVSVLSTCLRPWEEDAVAEAFWTWLAPVGERLDAVWGFVTCDPETLPFSTPYDEWYGILREGSRLAREHPRGYCTAALTAAAQASGLRVEHVPDDAGHDYTVVAIGAPITAYTDDQLRAVRDLLEPVLIKREPREYDPNDWPSRILSD
ncbi:hypothetical protein GCM10023317_32170 [Actinopolymorpha pittospori]